MTMGPGICHVLCLVLIFFLLGLFHKMNNKYECCLLSHMWSDSCQGISNFANGYPKVVYDLHLWASIVKNMLEFKFGSNNMLDMYSHDGCHP